MAAEPSPTAEATRLTERRRTSPTANTPGMLVSSGAGGRRGDLDGVSLEDGKLKISRPKKDEPEGLEGPRPARRAHRSPRRGRLMVRLLRPVHQPQYRRASEGQEGPLRHSHGRRRGEPRAHEDGRGHRRPEDGPWRRDHRRAPAPPLPAGVGAHRPHGRLPLGSRTRLLQSATPAALLAFQILLLAHFVTRRRILLLIAAFLTVQKTRNGTATRCNSTGCPAITGARKAPTRSGADVKASSGGGCATKVAARRGRRQETSLTPIPSERRGRLDVHVVDGVVQTSPEPFGRTWVLSPSPRRTMSRAAGYSSSGIVSVRRASASNAPLAMRSTAGA